MFFMRGITTWKKKTTVILSKLINTGLIQSLFMKLQEND